MGMLWDWLVRRVRVEMALWDCYWWAWDHRDWDSFYYCEEHSWAVRLFWRAVEVAVVFVLVSAVFVIEGLLRRLRYL